jgi:heme a synthase
MPRRFVRLAWSAAAATYLLIVLGAIVRITGSGLGCGEHWPLCNGRLFPPMSDLGAVIEWNHRLVALLVSVLVVALAGYSSWKARDAGWGMRDGTARLSLLALGLLALQVALGAVTVKLALPAWSVVLHLGTAMLLLATLLIIARQAALTPGTPGTPGCRPGLVIPALAFATVLMGALTANLGAASACLGFPLCNRQLFPTGNWLQDVHWAHRLLGFALLITLAWWAWRTRRPGPMAALGLALAQIGIAAAMVLLALPPPPALQAAHAAVGTALWGAVVLAT